MIDISSVKSAHRKKQTKKFWLLVVDQATNMKWSFFLKKKDQQVGVIIDLVKNLRKLKPRTARYIRCDNAGENKSLEKQMQKEGMGTTFEYTPRHTPQQNGKVERNFATLYGRMRAMMKSAALNSTERAELWTEAASTATKLDNILMDE